MSKQFVWPIRVYYEDTDAGGVVYHSQYLNFLERARTEWLRSLGFDQSVMAKTHQLIFVVRKLSIQYRKPAVFDDAIEIVSSVTAMSRCTITFNQKIMRNNEMLTETEVEIASIDHHHFRPVAIPEIIKSAMNGV
jgi:acyl-CoA thioester hydrolase